MLSDEDVASGKEQALCVSAIQNIDLSLYT